MGAVALSTKSVVAAAPVAAHLVRNQCSRFMFSHDFSFIPLCIQSCCRLHFDGHSNDRHTPHLTSAPHLTSPSWNCLLRPKNLETVCMCDFFMFKHSKFQEFSNNKFEFDAPHPQKKSIEKTQQTKNPICDASELSRLTRILRFAHS